MTTFRQVKPPKNPLPSQASDSQQAEGLVLERVQPKPDSHMVSTDQVDYLDVTIKQDKHGQHCELYDKKDVMTGQQADDELLALDQS